jgi:hypothetical protein
MTVDPRILAALEAPLKGGPTGLQFRCRSKNGKLNPMRGYAAAPGSGPEGETCRSCAHTVMAGGYSKNYWKCGLINWTNGKSTDIVLKSPACARWEAKG